MSNSKISLSYSILLLVFCLSCNAQDPSNVSKTKSSKSITDSIDSQKVKQPRIENYLEFNSIILSIFEDSKGNIWFGSWCDGLCKYDPAASQKAGEKQFYYYTVEQGIPGNEMIQFNNRTLPKGNSIRSILEDQNGDIIFATIDDLVKFDGKKFTKIVPDPEKVLITEYFDPLQEEAEKAWEKELEYLWIGNAQSNGAYRYDGNKLVQLIFPEIDPNGFQSQYATYSLYKDRNKNIWFGTEGGGIFKYDGKSFTCINKDESKGIVRSFYQDISGRLWISNVLMGLYYFDYQAFEKEEKHFFNFTKEIGAYNLNETRADDALSEAMFLDGVQTITQDPNGLIWIGSYANGLWTYDGKELTHYEKGKGLPGNSVKTIFKDSKGTLWFGIGSENEKAHVYHFNGKSFDRF